MHNCTLKKTLPICATHVDRPGAARAGSTRRRFGGRPSTGWQAGGGVPHDAGARRTRHGVVSSLESTHRWRLLFTRSPTPPCERRRRPSRIQPSASSSSSLCSQHPPLPPKTTSLTLNTQSRVYYAPHFATFRRPVEEYGITSELCRGWLLVKLSMVMRCHWMREGAENTGQWQFWYTLLIFHFPLFLLVCCLYIIQFYEDFHIEQRSQSQKIDTTLKDRVIYIVIVTCKVIKPLGFEWRMHVFWDRVRNGLQGHPGHWFW